MKKQNKKAQMTILVIVALVIIAAIVIALLFRKNISPANQTITNPELTIEKCAKDAALEAVGKMMPQGGFVKPINYKTYNNINTSYLCQNIGNYFPCINQHPDFINDEKQEIKNYTSPIIEKCFEDFKSQESGRNEKVGYGAMEMVVSLAPGKIYLNIERNTTITKNGETATYSEYNTEIDSPLYDLANVAIEIASNQANYCYFEYAGYMILHPQFAISVFTMSDSTRIYTIEDKNTGQEMNIAIRGCAIPPGI